MIKYRGDVFPPMGHISVEVVIIQRMVNVFRPTVPTIDPKRRSLFHLASGGIRVTPDCHVAGILVNNDVTGAGIGFGGVTVPESYSHCVGTSVPFG